MIAEKNGYAGFLKALGPGILFAGAAIGGSHLIQSTRAGADYGFLLLGLVVLINILKYPFFEFVHRYTAVTGESILVGYRRVGMWVLVCFFILAILSAVMNAAAVTLITAAILGYLTGIAVSPLAISAGLLALVVILLAIGRYPALDLTMKIMVFTLGLATIIAVVAAAGHGSAVPPGHTRPDLWTMSSVAFYLALMGWMPAPIDVSVWPSLWALEREEQTRYKPSLREALFDFHMGYVTTSVLALAFVSLGALVMFGTGERFSPSGVTFSGQLISLYTKTLGGWSFWVIAAVAFITMLSTMLTVFDGYSRTLKGSMELIVKEFRGMRWIFWGVLLTLVSTSLLIIGAFMEGMRALVDWATILAFLLAPFLAFMNFRAVMSERVPEEARPPRWLRIMAWMGIVFLAVFSVVYVVFRIKSG